MRKAKSQGRALWTETVERDGILEAVRITVDLTTRHTAAEIAALRKVFPSVLEQVELHLDRARKVIERGAEGTQGEYAEQAIEQGREVIRYLSKGNADGAVQHTLWLMQALWRMDFKTAEPEIITGAKSRRGAAASRSQRQLEAANQQRLWQQQADAIWKRNPTLSVASVARLIDRNRWDYIRTRLKKSGG